MTMFSFGTIKINTAMFGAVNNVKPENEIHLGSKPIIEAIDEIQSQYPLYSTNDYRKKIRLISACYWLLARPWPIAVITRLFKWSGIDTEEQQIKFVRGFSKDDENYLSKFRIKPCASILKVIIMRTENYTAKDHAKKMENYFKM